MTKGEKCVRTNVFLDIVIVWIVSNILDTVLMEIVIVYDLLWILDVIV